MLMFVLLAIIGFFLFYYYIVKPYHYWTDRGVKQSNPKWILGDTWTTLKREKNIAELIEIWYKQCPGVRYFGMYQFSTPTLMVKDPDLIKLITVKDFDHFTDHLTFIPEGSDPLWNKNLFSLKGQNWHEMRSILSPSFTSSKMKTMFVLMKECAENFIQHFQDKNEDVVTIEFKDTFTRFANDVIATTAFGIQVDSLGQPKNDFYLMGKEATNFTGFWTMMKFFGYFLAPRLFQLLKISLFSHKVSKFFSTAVIDTIKTREEKGIVRPDMINLLLEARKGIQRHEEKDVIDTGFSTAEETYTGKAKLSKEISDIEIAAQAIIFFLAGFDTASTLMCFMAYELAVNPEIQERLRHEVKSTLDKCEKQLTYEGLLKMKYLDMVVSETLRKWTPAVELNRVCTKPYTIEPVSSEEKPIHLDKGSILSIPVYGIHRDPQYFPDPEKFDPERFSDENKNNIKPYTYFPFGLGPRNCIGSRFALLEAKTVFFYLLNSFEIIPVEKSVIPVKLCKNQLGVTAEGGFWFGLKRLKE